MPASASEAKHESIAEAGQPVVIPSAAQGAAEGIHCDGQQGIGPQTLQHGHSTHSCLLTVVSEDAGGAWHLPEMLDCGRPAGICCQACAYARRSC